MKVNTEFVRDLFIPFEIKLRFDTLEEVLEFRKELSTLPDKNKLLHIIEIAHEIDKMIVI